jgi:hypothetical protein
METTAAWRLVLVREVSPMVLGVEEDMYGMRGGSARRYARSTTPGVTSCGRCGRTEDLQAPAVVVVFNPLRYCKRRR